MKWSQSILLALWSLSSWCASVHGQLTVESKDDRLVISGSGRPVADFVFRDEKILRPYLANVHSVTGHKVTRNHPPVEGVDAVDHAEFHPGIWLGFGDISGSDFWRNKARIEHGRFTVPPAVADGKLTWETESRLLALDKSELCRMKLRVTLEDRPTGRLVIWDATFHDGNGPFTFGDQEEMGFGARLATPLTEKAGGTIVNAAGQKSAARTWGQPAAWCDYAREIDGRRVGITLMAAPGNFRESWWHNRDYGVFVANPFGRAAMKQGDQSAVTVGPGEQLRLVFAAVIHDSADYDPAAAYQDFLRVNDSRGAEVDAPVRWIGYTELSTNVAGGRHANVRTMRAAAVKSDGTARRVVAPELANEPDSWTQFAGWSPDRRTAVIGRGWQSPENAKWEEEHRTFRHSADGWLVDAYLVDFETGKSTNVTAVERVSFYNSVFFWPNDPDHLGLTALVGGASKPFRMDRDGRNKIDLNKESQGFAYGFTSSKDGQRIAYHENYQVYLANADGSNRKRVETGQPFNFVPTWSPDGQWVLFVSGEHYNCHPHIVRADGTGLRKIADRGGYRGVTEFLDVHDFHGGSSDTPVWAPDGKSVYYTAQVEGNVELFQVPLDGPPIRLTNSQSGATHYHPQPSPDGRWLLYGSKRDGVRQLFVMRLADRSQRQLTQMKSGQAAMWPHW